MAALVEPLPEPAGEVADVAGAHLPLDCGAALAGEGGAVVGAVVNEHGVCEADAVSGQPRPEEGAGVIAFRR
jgi:hypothetical protein